MYEPAAHCAPACTDWRKDGTVLCLPSGSDGVLRGNGAWLRAVVIEEELGHRLAGEADAEALEPGSYFGSIEGAAHDISCEAADGCTLYVSKKGKYDLAAK